MTPMSTAVSSRAPTVLDVERVRRDFPILTRMVHDRPLVYLDSAASSQRPLAVIDPVRHYDSPGVRVPGCSTSGWMGRAISIWNMPRP